VYSSIKTVGATISDGLWALKQNCSHEISRICMLNPNFVAFMVLRSQDIKWINIFYQNWTILNNKLVNGRLTFFKQLYRIIDWPSYYGLHHLKYLIIKFIKNLLQSICRDIKFNKLCETVKLGKTFFCSFTNINYKCYTI